jgi:xanthine dehydrogenase accessory factor
MSAWIEAAAELVARGEDFVTVTVAAVRGSAPREPGARMIVTRATTLDTIGGGNLEAACVARARELLAADAAAPPRLVRYPLGPGFGQCCGGAATLLFERVAAHEFERVAAHEAAWISALREHARAGEPCVLVSGAEGCGVGAKLVVARDACMGTLGDADLDARMLVSARALLAAEDAGAPRLLALDAPARSAVVFVEPIRPSAMQIVLFGAGHVGRALVSVLAGVDCRVTWVDSRAGEFPPGVPPNTRIVVAEAPELEVDRASAGAYFLVMTHSHPLDFELCERILARGDFAYLGLIGSVPKRNRFAKYLRREGVPDAALARLTCPIGVAGIAGKRPATIAVAVAAQLLQLREAAERAARPAASEAARADAQPPARRAG